MEANKDAVSLLKDSSSPAMVRRLRSSFLAFCMLTLCASIFLLWNYGTTVPLAFHGIEDVDEDVSGGLATTGSGSAPAATNPPTVPAPNNQQQKPPTSSDGLSASQSVTSNLPYFDLVWWLRSFGRVPGTTLIFMMAYNTDMAAVFNMYETLEKFGRQENLIVMCLEKACLQAPEVITFDVSGMNKNSVKIAASVQLLNENFNFVFLDADVYLTGSIDPFEKMATLEQTSWDIQFFPSGHEGAKGIDSSFYFARPQQYTKDFFKRIKEHWKEDGDQDLTKIMNIIGYEMANGEYTLRIKQLNGKSFSTWEDHMDWEAENFNKPEKLNQLHSQTAALHMTCVDPSLRTYLAKNLGAWVDGEGYYKRHIKYLGVKGLEGDPSHAAKIIGFAAKVALDTQRNLIFPSSAIITQARKNAQTGASDYVKVPEFPAYRIVDPSSLEPLGLRTVEAMFLNNRARFTDKPLKQETIIMGNGHSVKDPSTGKPVVVKTINDKKNVDIFWLDMGSGRWWDLDASGAMAQYTKDVQNTMRVCSNANEEKFECNKRCT